MSWTNFGAMILLGLSLLFVLSVPHVYAINSSTDKTSYGPGDKITISGNVGNMAAGKYIGLQIRSFKRLGSD
ncbi:hypothetical protein QVH35_01100 [Candidatus Nitrosotenuis chungbukensis]|uniref:hypothetical protein n=1 Tax=Candidatus Nitrosotenuis chungbukensis TaxID=1353246 RepID=UPI0026721555|nr:hypothetical protein [Candidatus Nitrosotenuis chungbukensis]WKT58146.1 hypothetical protein QVH35_01100 [Candidatus Nitrosotenuis chungbukensis]